MTKSDKNRTRMSQMKIVHTPKSTREEWIKKIQGLSNWQLNES